MCKFHIRGVSGKKKKKGEKRKRKKERNWKGVKKHMSLPTGIAKNIVPRKSIFKQNSS